MKGKEKCEMLKAIRKNIAEMNGIEYTPAPCTHEGDCQGYCPRCDLEAEQLMRELRRKEAAGVSICIDTESLIDFETLASEPIEDDKELTLSNMGNMRVWDGEIEDLCEKDVETLQGDIAEYPEEEES